MDVVATRPSVSQWFEYVRKRTSDMASSGSFSMSVRTKTRGFSAADARVARAASRVRDKVDLGQLLMGCFGFTLLV